MTTYAPKTCRICDELLRWNVKLQDWRPCRNGCSSCTAAIPDGTERTYAAGSDDEGRPVRGDAIRRMPTSHD